MLLPRKSSVGSFCKIDATLPPRALSNLAVSLSPAAACLSGSFKKGALQNLPYALVVLPPEAAKSSLRCFGDILDEDIFSSSITSILISRGVYTALGPIDFFW